MTHPKPTLWKTIAEALAHDIAQGRYGTGDKLPTEAELSRRFGVNRHTIRRALATLAEANILHSRQGSGVFVTHKPLDYALGRRVRFSQNLAAGGHVASTQRSRVETVMADEREAQALGISIGAAVHVVEGISLSDGQPIATSRSVFPADRLPDFLQALAEHSSITAALAACGVGDYTRLSTRLTAKLATPVQAAALQIKEGAPILRSDAVNIDAQGVPIEFGRTWFAGDRVTLTVQPD
jgi:GntR family transcriptional regulator, phosphonate transport system regulatory protein